MDEADHLPSTADAEVIVVCVGAAGLLAARGLARTGV